MKYSVAAATAVLALASGVVAKPQITNSGSIDPKEGKAFTLELSGCAAGCTVYLMQGAKDQQVPVKVLDSSATTSAKITLSDVGSGSYSIRVKDNSVTGTAGDDNANNDYTGIFAYTGTGPTSFPPLSGTASATSSSASASSSSAASSSASSSSSATSSASSSSSASSASSASTSATSASSASATSSSSKASSSASKTAGSATASPTSTTPPSAGNMVALSPLGLIGAAAAALFL